MTSGVFQDKVAIITGAGIGIGFEIAMQLASAGACIILNDVDADLAKDAAKKIQASGGRCKAFGGDSSDLICIKAMINQAVQSFGKLDMAIANAGITTFGDFLTYTEKQFQRIVTVNLQGSYFLAQQAAIQMIQQKSPGRILFMSSVTGHQFHPDLAAYGMTKSALQMLAKSLGVELAPKRITVNALSPGATLTERTRELDPDFEGVWSGITPAGKVAMPEDIAEAALFFLSPAAHHITGQTLIIDGGWTGISPPPY